MLGEGGGDEKERRAFLYFSPSSFPLPPSSPPTLPGTRFPIQKSFKPWTRSHNLIMAPAVDWIPMTQDPPLLPDSPLPLDVKLALC